MLDLDYELNVNEMYNPENDTFSLIPDGWYSATINAPEVKITKDGTGQYVSWMLKIFGANYAGRVLFDIFNIKNQSEEAQRIGRESLGRVMHTLNIEKTGTLRPFDGRNVMIKIGHKDPSDSDKAYAAKNGTEAEPKNVVKGYKAFVPGGVVNAPSDFPPANSMVDDEIPF